MSTAGDVVYAKSFSQPIQQSGSYSFPNPLGAGIVVNYDPNVSKYVFYVAGSATTVNFAQTVVVVNTPANYAQSHTFSGSAEWLLKGAAVATVLPTFDYRISWLNSAQNASPPNPALSEVAMRMESTVAAVFSAGSPVLKFVINITTD